MGSFIIKFKNVSGEEGTIIADAGFNYSDKLSNINEANVKLTGSSESKRSLIEIGSEVYIYRNGTLEFHGLIDSIDFLENGGISAHASGYEIWLAKENGDYSNSPWQNTASATIFSNIIGESSKLSAGTIETGMNIDFREEVTDSLWNAISNLRQKTQQDIQIDYVNSEVDVLDHKGSSTSVATFNAGIQISNIRVSQSYPLGNDVRVYGKGDGTNQIKSDHTSHGQDATSKSTYGTIRKIHKDPTVLSPTEADALADALVAMYKDPVKVYDFEVLNPNQNIVSGDVITLNSKAQGLSNESVRIVGIEKGVNNGEEYLTLQVTNTAYARLIKNRNEILAAIEKNYRDYQTYMQGTTNVLTFPEMINANNSAPLRVLAYLPSSYIFDEAGNKRVNDFSFDFDVDPYRRGIGTSSEDDIAPDVGGSSSNTEPGVFGNSSNTQPGVSGTSGSTTPSSAAGVSVWSTYTVCYDDYWSYSLCCVRENLVGGPTYFTTRGEVLGANMTGSTATVNLTMQLPSGTTIPEGNQSVSNNSVRYFESGESGSANKTGWYKAYDGNFDCTYGSGIIQNVYVHTHGSHDHSDGSYYSNNHLHADGSYYADNHGHGDGSFAAASHNHNVAIGDGVSDAGSINATATDVYVDWWNGASWINRASGSAGTMGNVDLSAGGALPDVAGFWRVRLYTNNSSPDLLQGVIKLKHELDT